MTQVKKYLTLLLFVAASTMHLQVEAKHSKHWAAKTAKIAWHAAQIGVGVWLMRFFIQRLNDSNLSYCKQLRSSKTWEVAGFGVASTTALYAGLSGIDKEFKLRKRLKKFFH